jgi:hypothetical protein
VLIKPAEASNAEVASNAQISPGIGLLPRVTNSLVPYSAAQIDQMLAGTQHPAILKTLMKCESQDTDVVRPDSNGLESYGLLQFNGTSTWNEFAPLAGVSSTPVNPTAAIKVADWMISHGYLARWTCAKLTGLIK